MSSPDFSSATTVFSKCALPVWFAIASVSFSSSAIPCSSAGWKCSSLILSNGGRLEGSVPSGRKGLPATSGFFVAESGDGDGEGLAARQGVMSAEPKRRTVKQEKRTRPEVDKL